MLSAKNCGVFVLLVGLGTGADVIGTVELHLSRHGILILILILILIHLLTAVGLTHSGSSTVYIYTQTVHRTTQ